jgi:hypothetical protein
MAITYHSWAEWKRAQAEEFRRLAQVVSLQQDRDVLLKLAAALDKEATKLEQKASALEAAARKRQRPKRTPKRHQSTAKKGSRVKG